MAIDPKSLTIDYKTLMNNTSISERVGLTKSSAGQQLLSSLSPTDLASAFPDYYKNVTYEELIKEDLKKG